MKKLNIALLTGGNSSEREVALESARTIEESLDDAKYEVTKIDVAERAWWRGIDRYDYAFVMIHGTPGEDGRISGLLDLAGIPYSCCGVEAMVVTFNKSLCKRQLAGMDGLNSAREMILNRGEAIDAGAIAKKLGLPLFVKPNASGSSCGVTKVKCADEIVPAVQTALTEGDTVLVEEAIVGREFACGVVILQDETLSLPVTEIVSKNDFFDYEAKYTAGMADEITPAPIPDALSKRLQMLAAEACRRCGCRGIVRADFIVTPDNRPYLIEINAIPGMSAGSIVPRQLRTIGLSISELCNRLIDAR